MKIYFGDDREKISREIKRELGDDYEVIEGSEVKFADLYNIFSGASLFSSERKILVKDFCEGEVELVRLKDFLDSANKVIVWESKLDKRSVGYKELKKAGVEMCEFKRPEVRNTEVFDVLDAAWAGKGKNAVMLCEKIEKTQDAYMFFGLMVTQMMKKYDIKQGRREKLALKELAECDKKMKSTGMEPWTLVKATLLTISRL